MRTSFCIATALGCALSAAMASSAQSAAKKSVSLAHHLELASEIAMTSDEGYPSALRVTVKNIGSVMVMTPMVNGPCSPDNGVQIQSSWSTEDGMLGGVAAGMCGITDQPSLLERVKTQWIRLQPGEYMTTMLRLALPTDRTGAVISYWVGYTPPDATAKEIEELLLTGYVIPTEKLETEHRSFSVR